MTRKGRLKANHIYKVTPTYRKYPMPPFNLRFSTLNVYGPIELGNVSKLNRV